MVDLTGRVAIVTGASRGIGKAIALRLASAGALVVAGARADHAQAVVGEIDESGGTALAVTLDVTEPASVAGMAQAALERFGRIDVLVNNAGIVRDQLLLRMKPAEWDAVIATNLTAAFACCRAVLRPMVKQRSGRIVNIGSVVGQTGNPGQANYAASKAGLEGFTRSLALEVASRGITANVVAPGMIETDMTAALDERARDALCSRIPMSRLGTSDDVAGAVCFLASDEASYITGQVLSVNGGMHL
jgi:3-oxoacyl-[acyl-carrier protein] reductase